jgi:hypothetical protein
MYMKIFVVFIFFLKPGLLLLTAFKVGVRVANGPRNGVEGKAVGLG